MQWLDGKKTYLVAACGIVFGILVIFDVVTADQLTEWANVIGGSIILVSGLVAGLRSAIGKIKL
jgi:hypothetical protein